MEELTNFCDGQLEKLYLLRFELYLSQVLSELEIEIQY